LLTLQTTKAAPKAKATKTAPAKPKAAPAAKTGKGKAPAKRKVLSEVDDNVSEGAMDVDDIAADDDAPEHSSVKENPAPKKNKTTSEKYTKVRRVFRLWHDR
jgi:hypothetical protein